MTAEIQKLVAWLQHTEQIHLESAKGTHDRARSLHHAEACRYIVEAIRRGEHLVETGRSHPTSGN